MRRRRQRTNRLQGCLYTDHTPPAPLGACRHAKVKSPNFLFSTTLHAHTHSEYVLGSWSLFLPRPSLGLAICDSAHPSAPPAEKRIKAAVQSRQWIFPGCFALFLSGISHRHATRRNETKRADQESLCHRAKSLRQHRYLILLALGCGREKGRE